MKPTKTPTKTEKISQYEAFLHKINLFCISGNNEGIKELVENADIWSYCHRVSNGGFSEKQQQSAIDNAFWKLCNTPKTDQVSQERQKFWATQKEESLLPKKDLPVQTEDNEENHECALYLDINGTCIICGSGNT
jgi:hypothetical protein